MWVCRSMVNGVATGRRLSGSGRRRRRSERAARLAGAQGPVGVHLLQHRLELRAEVADVQRRLVQHRPALRAVPAEAIDVALGARALHHHADGVRPALRRVRHQRRQQEDVPLLHRDVARPPVLDHLHHDVALELVEQLLVRVDVVVVAAVRAADDHHLEVGVLEDEGVADRRAQQVPVRVDPGLEIERRQLRHEAPPSRMVRMDGGPQGFVSRFGGRINAESAAEAVSVAAVFGAIVAFCLTYVTDSDLFWHLAAGDLIRSTGHVPTSDTFSYTVYGLPWVDVHWLYQVLVSYLAETTGLAAVEIVKTLLITGLFAWLWRRGRREAGAVPAAGILLLAALACQERFLTRPEIVSWWLLAATLATIGAAVEDPSPGRRRRLLFIVMPLLVLLWVNMQALFILAPAMTVLALV